VLGRRIAKDRAVLTDWYGQHKLMATRDHIAVQRICGPPDYDRVISANVRSRSVSRSITPSRATSTSLRVTLSLSS